MKAASHLLRYCVKRPTLQIGHLLSKNQHKINESFKTTGQQWILNTWNDGEFCNLTNERMAMNISEMKLSLCLYICIHHEQWALNKHMRTYCIYVDFCICVEYIFTNRTFDMIMMRSLFCKCILYVWRFFSIENDYRFTTSMDCLLR